MRQPLYSVFTALAFLVSTPALAGDFDWLTGHWRSESDGEVSEEMWMNGEGGVYFAVSRTIKGGKTGFFEFVRLTTGENPAYIVQPRAGEAVTFPLVEHTADKAVFLNADHDYPQKIAYERQGNRMMATISNADGSNANSWHWTLVQE